MLKSFQTHICTFSDAIKKEHSLYNFSMYVAAEKNTPTASASF